MKYPGPALVFRQLWSILAGLFTVLALVACGGGTKGLLNGSDTDAAAPSPAELLDFSPTITLRKRWSKSSGDGAEDHYLRLSPIVSQGRVYTADYSGNVQALSADRGKLLWRTKTRLPISGGPGGGQALVLVGSSEGAVLALDAKTGEERWRTQISSEVLTAPQHAGDYVVVRTGDGAIHCLTAEGGKSLWTYNSDVPSLTLRGASAPVIVEDVVVSGLDSGTLTVLEIENGKEIWSLEIAVARGRSELERMVDIDTRPIVRAGIIYMASFQGQVLALQISTGETLWQRRISTYVDLGMDSSRVYVSDDQGHVWALDRFTGETIWSQEFLELRRITAPAVIGDALVVGDFSGYIHALDRFTGTLIARERVSSERILAPPWVVEDTVYVYSSDGVMSAWVYEDIPSVSQ